MAAEYTYITPVFPDQSDAPVVRLSINKDGSTDYKLVTGTSGKKIRVLHFYLAGSAAVQGWLVSDGSSDTEMMGAGSTPVSTAPINVYNPSGIAETQSGDDLDLRTSGTGSVDGFILYQVLDA